MADQVTPRRGRRAAAFTGAAALAVLAAAVAVFDPALDSPAPSATTSNIPVARTSHQADPTKLDARRGSFASPGVSPDATPEMLGDPLALTPFRNEAGGYELGLPASWLGGLVADDVVELVGVTIVAGDRDGHLDTCGIDLWPCADTPITTLARIDDAIDCAPSLYASSFPERHADTTLGGEPARIESLKIPRKFVSGPPAWYCVYAIHDGRPYVLAFDYWSIRYTPFFAARVDKIIASFKFID